GAAAAGRHAEEHVVQVHHDGSAGRRGDGEVRPLAQRHRYFAVVRRGLARYAGSGQGGGQGGDPGENCRTGHPSGLWIHVSSKSLWMPNTFVAIDANATERAGKIAMSGQFGATSGHLRYAWLD